MPVVTIGENTADDFSGCEASEIRSGEATTNIGLADYGYIYYTGYNLIIGFSGLSNIASSVTVNATSINLYVHDVAGTIEGRPLLVAFVDDEVTWNIRSTGNNWTTAGAQSDGNDRRSTASFSQAVSNGPTAEYVSYTGTQLIADVEDQIDGTMTNYGYVLQATAGYHQHQSFADGKYPYLEVDYTAGASGAIPLLVGGAMGQAMGSNCNLMTS